MTDLILAPNLNNTDDFYAALLAAYDGLDEGESHALNARLVLILANHIGDEGVLTQALDAAVMARSSPGQVAK
ncbi:MAG: DUF2783 domain-containing protein [Flavimaricola sp.]|nr:DUF2783 domain-containing protein [Flavimaricola sp.]